MPKRVHAEIYGGLMHLKAIIKKRSAELWDEAYRELAESALALAIRAMELEQKTDGRGRPMITEVEKYAHMTAEQEFFLKVQGFSRKTTKKLSKEKWELLLLEGRLLGLNVDEGKEGKTLDGSVVGTPKMAPAPVNVGPAKINPDLKGF
ncbi:MAG: hypothetical protein ACREQ5_07350 [Candidatus Dormibacteria bacterium]